MNESEVDPLVSSLRDRFFQLQDYIAQLSQTESQSADLLHLFQAIEEHLQQVQAERDRSFTTYKRLQENERFAKAFHANPIPATLSILQTGQLLDINNSFLTLSGYQREEAIQKTSFELGLWTNLEEHSYWMTQLQEKKSIQEIEIQFRTRLGEILDSITSLELFEVNDELCVLTQVRDVTQQKQAERALRESESKLSAVLESAIGVINRFRVFEDRSWEYDYVSPGAELIFGYTPEELIADRFLWVSRVPEEDLQQTVYSAYDDIFAERTTVIEYRFHHKNGQLKWLSSTIFSQRQEAEQCWLVTSVHFDISDRKQMEEQLQTSLQEKEILLREVHHRVKNNLQVILSLLDLQAQQSQDIRLKEAFRESQNRIRSMAIIHEKLYQTKHVPQVNLADYIRSLTGYLIESYAVDPDRITLHLDLESIALNLDTAIPCGLILNELVSNALKHAFPNNQTGTILVTLHSLKTPYATEAVPIFELTVGNNGVQLPASFSFSNRNSLGAQLITLLSEQIQGQIEVRQTEEVNFVLRFSELDAFI